MTTIKTTEYLARSVGVAACIALLAVGATPNGASADTIWGSTFGAHSEIFSVDTATGAIGAYKDFGNLWFGDIAYNFGDGYLYVTQLGTSSFNTLSQIDVATLTIQQSWTLPTTMNALNWKPGTTDTLYGIQGGGALDGDLYEITINGGTMTTSVVGTVPSIASDGDLAQDPTTGVWYATFLPNSTTYLWDLDVNSPAGSTQGAATGVYNTSGRYFVSGLAFESDGTLWGGSWGSAGEYDPRQIYTINPGTGSIGTVWDLSGTLQGSGVTGLTTIPAPGAVVLGAMGLGAIGWIRRRIG